MNIQAAVNEIANQKGLSLEELHIWLLKQKYTNPCCNDKGCQGRYYEIDNIVLKIQGHCYQLVMSAKFKEEDESKFVDIHFISDH